MNQWFQRPKPDQWPGKQQQEDISRPDQGQHKADQLNTEYGYQKANGIYDCKGRAYIFTRSIFGV